MKLLIPEVSRWTNRAGSTRAGAIGSNRRRARRRASLCGRRASERASERARERKREREREGETALKDRWIAAMLNSLASYETPACLLVIVARDATTPPAPGIATPSGSRTNQWRRDVATPASTNRITLWYGLSLVSDRCTPSPRAPFRGLARRDAFQFRARGLINAANHPDPPALQGWKGVEGVGNARHDRAARVDVTPSVYARVSVHANNCIPGYKAAWKVGDEKRGCARDACVRSHTGSRSHAWDLYVPVFTRGWKWYNNCDRSSPESRAWNVYVSNLQSL